MVWRSDLDRKCKCRFKPQGVADPTAGKAQNVGDIANLGGCGVLQRDSHGYMGL